MLRLIALSLGTTLVGCSTPKPLYLPPTVSSSSMEGSSSSSTEDTSTGPGLVTCVSGAAIQAAIDDAGSTELIPVCAGTHEVNLVIRRAVILESEDPEDPAILDGGNLDPVITVPEYRTVVLRNLVITNGNGGSTRAGGVDGPASDAITIDGCTIRQNSGLIGGVQGSYGAPLDILDSQIMDNEGDLGGGISIGQGSLTRVDVSGNHATNRGGGITVYPFQGPTIEELNVVSNSTDGIGGGVALDWSSSWVGGHIENNSAERGGGIGTVATSTILIEDAEIVSNSATLDGGGIFNEANIGGLMVMRNLLIEGNSADEGGGLYLQQTVDGASSFLLEDVDIQSNVADYGGGASMLGAQFDVTNGSITSNTGGIAGGGVRLAKLGVLNAVNVDLGTAATSNSPDDVDILGVSYVFDGVTTTRCDTACD